MKMNKPVTEEELLKFLCDELKEAIFDFNKYTRGETNSVETPKESCIRLKSFISTLELILYRFGFNVEEEKEENGCITKYIITEPRTIFEYEEEEMEAKEFLLRSKKLCDVHERCTTCPLRGMNCMGIESDDMDEMIKIVEEYEFEEEADNE